MTRYKQLKINQLLQKAPGNAVLTLPWLRAQGISSKLAWWYCNAGWFERIADGAYHLAGQAPDWQNAVATLQKQLNLPVYPAAKTALLLHGKTHYLYAQESTIQLFADPKTKLPTWAKAPCWEPPFKLFCPNLFTPTLDKPLVSIAVDGTEILVSSPEQAAFELCYLVPNAVTFAESAAIFEGLSRLRPGVLQTLLEHCLSYRVKRMVLFFADSFAHPWLSDIKPERIDLGKGKKVIAGGGYFNAKYQISTPPLEQ